MFISSHSSPLELFGRVEGFSHLFSQNTTHVLLSHLTSVCVHHHSREPPVRVSVAARVRFLSGRRSFGPGRCMQHAARHPCMGRQRQKLHQFPKISKSSLFHGEHLIDAGCSHDRRKRRIFRRRVYPVGVQIGCVSLSL